MQNKFTQRADIALVERKLFPSRAKAREAISAGLVRADGRILQKASAPIANYTVLEASAPHPWVSRGGVKLAAGLEAFALCPADCVCLDVGVSTGGFTHVLLERGATEVICVDVGKGQLHPALARDSRVVLREGMDARALAPAMFRRSPSFLTCDVSFISLALVLPAVLPLAAARAHVVALIKPQFEAGPGRTTKGVVKNRAIQQQACDKIASLITSLGWEVIGTIPSPITGGDGNQEFLLGAKRG
ncbi:MAG TPA: TlyA family RNA methyltransferase [Methylocella sp.]|nr:TlyA family RNA methyltransferase [Methylocella sp.]